MASSWIHRFNGGWTTAQERVHCQLSTGVPVRDRYNRFRCVWVKFWSSHHVCFSSHSYRKFQKGGQEVSCRENGRQASKSVRRLWNHMGTPNISPHCHVTAGGHNKRYCVHCDFQTPKPSFLIENLRNCSGEKVSLLRRNPLGDLQTDYILMMLELSKEQGFEVTYFNIGMTLFVLVFIQLMQQVQAGVSLQSLLVAAVCHTGRTAFQITAPPGGLMRHRSWFFTSSSVLGSYATTSPASVPYLYMTFNPLIWCLWSCKLFCSVFLIYKWLWLRLTL